MNDEDDEDNEDADPVYEERSDTAALDGEVEVSCPHCGESVSIAVDQGGGAAQDYVEDCPVCCRPWHVHVRLTRSGGAQVHLEEQ